jgi:uncharacterized protein (TIGR00251 family)
LVKFALTEGVIFTVRVVPRSSTAEIVGEYDGAIKIKLKSPPVDGAANEELIRFISKLLAVPRSNIEIISGQASRTKRIQVMGATPEQIDAILKDKF